MASVLNKNEYLLKCIVVVLDDDLMTFLGYNNMGATEMIGTWMEWLMNEFISLIDDKKLKLAKRAYRDGEPFIYWTVDPMHNRFCFAKNDFRHKYNQATSRKFQGVRIIKLKDHWDPSNTSLVTNDKITDEGIAAYWHSINSAVKFNLNKRDLFLAKAKVNAEWLKAQLASTYSDQKASFFIKKKCEDSENKFHWHRKDVREDRRPRFLLLRLGHKKRH